jgi:hypothetical protein
MNSIEFSTEFHGENIVKNPSNVYEKFHGIPWKIQLTEFHGIRFRQGSHHAMQGAGLRTSTIATYSSPFFMFLS